MKQAYLLVEGPTDAAFLGRILPPDALRGTEVVRAGGLGGMTSLARSLLVRRRRPVAVVMDADSFNPAAVEARRRETEELIRMAGGATPVRVVMAVPEIEAWLFAAPAAIERVAGRPLTPELVRMGQLDPRGTLLRIAAEGGQSWDTARIVTELDEDDIGRIRQVPEVESLINFLSAEPMGSGGGSSGDAAAPFARQLLAAGYTDGPDRFCDVVAGRFDDLYPGLSGEELKREPLEAHRFCDRCRDAFRLPTLPDRLILRGLEARGAAVC